MSRFLIPFATLAAVFSLWYYPDESKFAAGSAQALSQSAMIVGASDSLTIAKPAPRPRFAKVESSIQLAAAPAASFDPAEAARRWGRIEKALRCASGAAACKLPESDSRAAHFALRDGLVEQVRWFQTQTPRTPSEQKQSFDAATRLLSYPDEAVQGAALEWILSLPVQDSTIPNLRQNLDLMVDPELVRLSLLEVKRHLGTDGEGEALDFVGHLLLEGGVFASREAARLAPSLLTPQNEARMRGWLAELPSDSAKARLLREGLEANRSGI